MWPINKRRHLKDTKQTNGPLLLISSSNQTKLLFNLRRLDEALLKITSKLFKLQLFCEPKRQGKLSRVLDWTNVLTIASLYSCLGLLRTLYHHYIYDYYMFQLNRLHESTQIHNRSKLELYLSGQVELSRRQLAQVGTPMIRAPIFSTECFYIIWLLDFSCICCFAMIRFRAGRLRTNWIRLLDSPVEEEERLTELFSIEANNYLDSNYNYIQTHFSRFVKLFGNKSYPSINVSGELKQLIGDYEHDIISLSCVFQQKLTLTMYKFSSQRIQWMCLVHLGHSALNLLLLSVVAIVIAIERFGSQAKDQTDHAANVIAFVQPVVITFTFAYIGSTVGVILINDWLDQIKLLGRLRGLIVNCVNVNRELIEEDKHQMEGKQLMMNANLLFVLINYKVFLRQMRHTLQAHKDCANICLFLMFVVPIATRLHTPYCSPDVWLYLVTVCLINSAFSTICIVPSCHLYEKCLALHRPMASLLAHVIKINTSNTYKAHLVWCLRQEMKNLDRFHESFLPKETPTSFVFTYKLLIKAHFWLHLITLSILFQTKGHILEDPLRLLSKPLDKLLDES